MTMSTIKTFLAIAFTFALATSAMAQSEVRGISDANSAVDLQVALFVKYIGTTAPSTTTTVAVAAATGDITLTVAGTDDVSVRCPFGGTAGIIDVSDAACNTFGEVIDSINFSGNWIAIPRGVLRTDSSTDTLASLAASTNVLNVGGAGLLLDTDIAQNFSAYLNVKGNGDDIRDYTVPGAGGSLKPVFNVFGDSQLKLYGITANATFGSGTNTISVSGVVREFNVAKGTSVIAPTAAAGAVYRETVRTIWSEAGAATTVEFIRRFIDGTDGLYGNIGESIIVREATSAATTPSAGYLFANGVAQDKRAR